MKKPRFTVLLAAALLGGGGVSPGRAVGGKRRKNGKKGAKYGTGICGQD